MGLMKKEAAGKGRERGAANENFMASPLGVRSCHDYSGVRLVECFWKYPLDPLGRSWAKLKHIFSWWEHRLKYVY